MAASRERKEERAPRRRLPRALPTLGPVAMRLYVLLWSLLLAASIAMPVMGAYFDIRQRDEPGWSALGLNVADDPQGVVVALVHGAQARASGLEQGDRIVAIDGRPVPRGLGADDRARPWVLGPDGSTKRLTIVADGRAPRDLVLVRTIATAEARYRNAGLSSASFMAILSVAGLSASLLLVVAAILLFRQRRQPVAALLSLGYLGVAAFSVTGGQAVGPLGIWIVSAAVQSLSWVCILLALITMPDGRFAPRWTVWIAAAIILNGALDMTQFVPDGAVAFLYSVLILAAVATLALRYRSFAAGRERQQLRWAFLGFAFGTGFLVFGLFAQAIAAALARADPRWEIWSWLIAVPFFTLGLAAFALGLMISLLRYRLYDADAAIGRSAGYAVLTLLLTGTFGASAKLIEWLFETGFGRDGGALPGAIGAGLAIVLITPLHNRVHGWAERRFQKDLTALRRDLPEAAGDLRETASLEELLDEVLARIERGVHVTGSAVALDGEIAARRGGDGPWLTEIPLAVAHQGIAVGRLLVGPRPDGSPIGKDEREALAVIADPVARAIRIVRMREAEQGRLEARAEEQDRRLAALEAALAKPRRRSRQAPDVKREGSVG